jgi:hypothetical protein
LGAGDRSRRERFDEVVLNERRPDDEDDVALQLRWLSEDDLVARRRRAADFASSP